MTTPDWATTSAAPDWATTPDWAVEPEPEKPYSILGDETRQIPDLKATTRGGTKNAVASTAETMVDINEALFNPRITFPRFEIKKDDPRPVTFAKEAVNIAAGLPEFFTSTVGLAGAALAPAAPLAVGGAFLADTLHSLGQQVTSSYANWDQMDQTQKDVAVMDMIGTGAFAALLGHGVKSGLTAKAIERAPMGIGEPARPKPVIPVSQPTDQVPTSTLTGKQEPVKVGSVKAEPKTEPKAELVPESVTDAGLSEVLDPVQGEVGPVDALVKERVKTDPVKPTVQERDWELFNENLANELDSFSPARETGKVNYDLSDLADRFVEFAKADQSGKSPLELVKDFANSDDAPASQIRKLRQSVKSLAESEPKQTPTPPAKGPEGKQVQITPEESNALKITQLKGVENRGDGIFFVPEKLMTPARRKLVQRGGNAVQVKAWADVTGVPTDKGYAILDRRARIAERSQPTPKPETTPVTKPETVKGEDSQSLAQNLFIKEGKRLTQVTPEQASKLMAGIRDKTGLGGSRLGNVRLYDINGKYVGFVSYNGNVWIGKEVARQSRESLAYNASGLEWDAKANQWDIPKPIGWEQLTKVQDKLDSIRKKFPELGDDELSATNQEFGKLVVERNKLTSAAYGNRKAIEAAPEPVKPQGMGGAVPEEFAEPGSYASNMFAAIDRDRVEMGKEPMELGKKRTWDEDNQKALAKMNREPNWLPELLSEVSLNPRPLLSWENAGLVWYRANLKAEAHNAMKRINLAAEDGRIDALNEAKADVTKFENLIVALDDAVGRGGTGSEAGRSLAAQKMATGQDFSLVEMRLEKRAVANDGKPLTPAQEAEVARLYKEIAEKDAALKKYEEEAGQRRANEVIVEIQREPYKSPYSQAVLDHAKKVVADHKKLVDQAEFDKSSEFFSNPDFQGMGGAVPGEFGSKAMPAKVLETQAKYWGQRSMEGLDRKGFDAEALSRLGDGAKPYLDQIWEAANKHVDEYLASLTAKLGKDADQVKRAVKKTDKVEVKADLTEKLQAKVDKGKRAEITGLVQKLARYFVSEGVREREALIDSVHGVLTEIDPTFTRRETMDAISGYGEFKQLTKDEISTKLRDLKGQMQQVGKIQDMTAGKAPSKTGLERRIPSDEERNLIKQVNELKKKGGFSVTDPATQLASALTARKTYYRNRLTDLKTEIQSRERIVKDKQPSPTDPELEAMKAEYKRVKEEHDEIFGNKALTDAQRLKLALAAAERGIKEYERRVKDKEFLTKKKFQLTETPELKLARARLETARETFKEFQDLDIEFQRAQELKTVEMQKSALEKSIADKESQLASGPKQPEGRPVNRPAADPVLEQLLQRRDILNQRLAESRKKPADVKYRELMDRKLADLNKRIAEKEAKIASGDVSTKSGQVNRPLSPELEVAKQKLEALNKQIEELRNPKKSPEERALQAFKTRKTREYEEYSKRLRELDFEPKSKKSPLKRDPEAELLEYYAFSAKEAWHKAMMEDRLAKAHPVMKAIRFGGEILNTQRAILTSADFSAVLRQGGFITMAHPIRSLKSFPAMFRAFASKSAAHAVAVEIMRRPNYHLYKSSKLYLSEHGQKLSMMEENYMSRWSDKIPFVAGSQRAYTTFLNKLRADSFDAMASTLSRTSELNKTEADAIANFVNVSTGRGSLGVKNDAALATLATVFFAPRYVTSRFQMIAGQPLYRGNARTRTMIAKEYGRFLAGVGIVYGLGKMAGATVEEDPRSSEFGKMRWGNTRIDPLAGLLQSTVLLSREASGAIKQSKSGKIVPIRGEGVPYKGTTGFDVLARFGRSKLAPSTGTAVNILAGSDVVGQPVTFASTATGLLVPLSTQDIYKVMQEQGIPEGTILTLLSIFGMGMQNFDASKHSKPEKSF